jgi:hypothetical protein
MMTKKPEVEVDLTTHDRFHLQCRDFKHAWTWVTDFVPHKDVETKRVATVTRTLKCMRCATVRHDEYAIPSFDRVKSSYEYPDGYLVHESHGHVPVAMVRSEIMRRANRKEW